MKYPDGARNLLRRAANPTGCCTQPSAVARSCGAIGPRNAPGQLAALKVAPAVCAGNTVVLKAAADAPLAVLTIAEICQDHRPPGVVNVVTAGAGDRQERVRDMAGARPHVGQRGAAP